MTYDIDVQKTIFVLDAEDAAIVAKIDTANAYDISWIHRARILSRSDMCGRGGVLPGLDPARAPLEPSQTA
jgi:hypothetical protein